MILDQLKSTSKISYVPFTNTFRKYKGLNMSEKMIYMCLWSMSGEKNYCFPAIETIADELEISESTVRRILKSLDEKKCIYTIRQKNKETEKQLSNLYYIIEFNPYEGKFNENHYIQLEMLYPTRIRYLDEEEIKNLSKKKKVSKENGNL